MSQEGYSGAKVLKCKISKTRDEKRGKFMTGKKHEVETQSADSDWMDKIKQGADTTNTYINMYKHSPPVLRMQMQVMVIKLYLYSITTHSSSHYTSRCRLQVPGIKPQSNQ